MQYIKKYLTAMLCLVSILQASIVKEQLQKIPVNDQKELHNFFHNILVFGDFSAVLLGDKPAFWIGPSINFLKAENRYIRDLCYLVYKGYKTWSKYAHLFPEANYQFLEDPDSENIAFWFFNTKKLAKKDLQNLLEEKKLCCSSKTHKKIGLILGYPESGVQMFAEQVLLENIASFFPYQCTDIKNQRRPATIDALENHTQNPLQRHEEISSLLHLTASWTENLPLFPAIPYHFQSCSDQSPKEPEWTEEFCVLYNSDQFLIKFLERMIQ